MRNTFKVLFYVNGSKEKNGVAPILGRITVNGQAAQFSCKQTVALSLWDAKANRAKGKGAEAQKINHALDKIKAKIIEHYGQIREREGFATAEMVKNLSPSAVWIYTVPLKMIVTRAHCDGHLHRNPFAQYHVSPQVKERQFLTEEELQTLMNHSFAMMSFSQIRDMFVFGCLTGISYIDIKNLTTDNLVNINGSWWIVANRKKTKVPFRVKLLDSALRIIERYEPFRNGNRLFYLHANTYINRALKVIAKECGIDKPLSFHCSRHTFSTLALSKGMPIESVSKILGHTKITTTQIYAKITTEKLEHDISAFGEKLETGLAVKPQFSTQPEREISPVKKERTVGRL